ncbi:hypothetical protein QN277_019078 [Acacia crassicarpa]|uniref:DUF4283 domain-containing protein n=1 Tax=Acacia crassicarpa TaxID=499986 RepID=A0AAE1JXY4_9FABA|nr:hypothetical protein QN277_019078 [Acacia crassicarpa]
MVSKEILSLALKDGSLPLSSEDSLRSTKKVRIRSDGMEVTDVDGGQGSMDSDVLMVEEGTSIGPSYRNMLLNSAQVGKDKQTQEEVVILEGDYQIRWDGNTPSIDFSEEIRKALGKGMERTLIIKFLGRSITYGDLLQRTQALWKPKGSFQLVDMEGSYYFATFDLEEDYTKVLTGGPWTIFGAYLTVQPWSIEFDPRNAKVSKVVVWVRILGLSFRYYHKSVLCAIGKLLGEVVKVDYMTETRGRGRYARIAVLIDLQLPLVP